MGIPSEAPTRDANAAAHPASAWKHRLAPLPYDHAALEPHIDARTMMLHHDKHHAWCVEKLNALLESFPDLQQKTAPWLLLNLRKLPGSIRAAVRHLAGGHVNHSLFWQAMCPPAGSTPSGALADAIEHDFGSFDLFKARFEEAGAALFGSGWVWLAKARKEGGPLEVITTSGQDNPLLQGRFPLLLNDAWEHAYYLKHENRRADYLKGWWPVVNWPEAARRYAGSANFTDSRSPRRYPWTKQTF